MAAIWVASETSLSSSSVRTIFSYYFAVSSIESAVAFTTALSPLLSSLAKERGYCFKFCEVRPRKFYLMTPKTCCYCSNSAKNKSNYC